MKLLLHACCGPCSLEPVRLLKEEGHDITIAYMNSNIAPASEYQHRLSTLLDWAKAQDIPVIEGPYEMRGIPTHRTRIPHKRLRIPSKRLRIPTMKHLRLERHFLLKLRRHL